MCLTAWSYGRLKVQVGSPKLGVCGIHEGLGALHCCHSGFSVLLIELHVFAFPQRLCRTCSVVEVRTGFKLTSGSGKPTKPSKCSWNGKRPENSAAEWIHFTLLGIILTTIKLKIVHFLGLMNSQVRKSYCSPHITRVLTPVSNSMQEAHALIPSCAVATISTFRR